MTDIIDNREELLVEHVCKILQQTESVKFAVGDLFEPKKNSNQERGRKPGTYQWFEIQDNIAYFAEFEQLKIVVPDLSPSPRFALEGKHLYPDMTAFVLSSSNPYLLGILNSALMEFFFLKISASVRGETFRFKKQYMEQLPIFPATDTQKSPITPSASKPSSPTPPAPTCRAWKPRSTNWCSTSTA